MYTPVKIKFSNPFHRGIYTYGHTQAWMGMQGYMVFMNICLKIHKTRIGSDRIGSDRTGSDWTVLDRIGSDRIRSDRIGSDRIDKTRTRSITPDNMLKFCAFLSCVCLLIYWGSSKCFFPKVITDSKAELWKIWCNELTAYTTVFFFIHENWRQFFTLPQSLLIAQYPDLASNRTRMSVDDGAHSKNIHIRSYQSRIPTILQALLLSTDVPFLLLNQAIVPLSETGKRKKFVVSFQVWRRRPSRMIRSDPTFANGPIIRDTRNTYETSRWRPIRELHWTVTKSMYIEIPHHVDKVLNLTNKWFLGVLHLGTP